VRTTALLVLAASLPSVAAGAGAPATAGTVARCGAAFPNDVGGLAGSGQLVTVLAPGPGTIHAVAQLWTRAKGGCFVALGGPIPALIGRSGLSTHHLEGDGSTPVGVYSFGPVMYGIDPDPGVSYRFHRLVCGDWWDEDPASAAYNRFVHVPCEANPPFGAMSEALWRIAPPYDWMAVIEYNSAPVVPGRGSGIFLHVSTGVATEGCVALPVSELLATLRWLDPARHPRIAIGTVAELSSASPG